jgi:uncharacterized protein (TIGR03437 family)
VTLNPHELRRIKTRGSTLKIRPRILKIQWPTAVLLLGVAMAIASQAQTPTTLANFSLDTAGPTSIIQGSDGNFYGTSGAETVPSIGVVYQMTPAGVLTTLYSAPKFDPVALLQGSDGNLYGAAPYTGNFGVGIIFQMTPAGAITPLYNFSGPDGANPTPGLVVATDGNFYGTTSQGGSTETSKSSGWGTIFQLSPSGTLTTLHSFAGADGASPTSGLIQASDGNFYGTTQYGGTGSCQVEFEAPGCGTIFKITPQGSYTTLHSFAGQDGALPSDGLIEAADGNFYGTTVEGGSSGSCKGGCGTIFKFTPAGSLTTLYSFNLTNGAEPLASLIQATDGNFYGTTDAGGGGCQGGFPPGGCGTIFKITPAGALTTLYNFPPEAGTNNRYGPGTGTSPLIQAANGNLFGTLEVGGSDGNGIVFELSLGLPPLILAPAISTTGGVLNGASFQTGIAADSWITINGTNLSSKTDTWSNAIVNGALPTTLDGVSVMVGDQAAYIEYVSATQINALAPSVPAGTVPVTVTTANGTSPAVMAQLSAEQPAFFQWGTYAVATRQNFSLAVKDGTFAGTTTVPAKPGDVIILWGTGFGPTSPSVPAGEETPSASTYNTASTVSVTVGKASAIVYGVALAPGYAGLYQIAIQIPALANGDYPVIATISGAQSPSTTMITVQQ